MDILSVNADSKLLEVASSIGQSPISWQGWLCLYIHVEDIDDHIYEDCLLWTKSIVESYLKDLEGRVYFCNNKTIHILCKSGTKKVLEQTGQQICDLIYSESALVANYKIYELEQTGFEYAQTVLKETDNIFSMPHSVAEKQGDPSLKEPHHDCNTKSQQECPRVLLVEDDPVTRWMVRNTLKFECEFATAPTANKAFGMYTSYQPDVVFLDIDLPDKNGYTVLEWIMNNDPGARVVMFSSNNHLDNITGALDEGATGFIAKPFLKEDLLHYVRGHENRA